MGKSNFDLGCSSFSLGYDPIGLENWSQSSWKHEPEPIGLVWVHNLDRIGLKIQVKFQFELVEVRIVQSKFQNLKSKHQIKVT